MPTITKVGRVMVPVSDQDEAIRFYTTAGVLASCRCPVRRER
jgi:hypothetical protein